MSKKSVMDMTKMFESNQNFQIIRKAEIRPKTAQQVPTSEEPILVASFRVNPAEQLVVAEKQQGLNEPEEEEEDEASPKLNLIKRPRQPNKAKPSSAPRLLNNTSDSQEMDSYESNENEQVGLLTDKTNFGELDDYEKRKQHAMQIEQILKPELLIDRRLFPESRTLEKKEALTMIGHEVTLSSEEQQQQQQSSNREPVDELKQEIRSLRSELDEARSELARVQINFNSFEIESRQALQKQSAEMDKLRKKLVFIMRKGFLAQMDATSTFIGNEAAKPSSTEAVSGGGGHISRPRTRKNANNTNNDSSPDENEAEDSNKLNKRKSSDYEEDGVIKF